MVEFEFNIIYNTIRIDRIERKKITFSPKFETLMSKVNQRNAH